MFNKIMLNCLLHFLVIPSRDMQTISMLVLFLHVHHLKIVTGKFNGNIRIFLKNIVCGCMLLSCHIVFSELIYTLQLPECQGTPCLKQT